MVPQRHATLIVARASWLNGCGPRPVRVSLRIANHRRPRPRNRRLYTKHIFSDLLEAADRNSYISCVQAESSLCFRATRPYRNSHYCTSILACTTGELFPFSVALVSPPWAEQRAARQKSPGYLSRNGRMARRPDSAALFRQLPYVVGLTGLARSRGKLRSIFVSLYRIPNKQRLLFLRDLVQDFLTFLVKTELVTVRHCVMDYTPRIKNECVMANER